MLLMLAVFGGRHSNPSLHALGRDEKVYLKSWNYCSNVRSSGPKQPEENTCDLPFHCISKSEKFRHIDSSWDSIFVVDQTGDGYTFDCLDENISIATEKSNEERIHNVNSLQTITGCQEYIIGLTEDHKIGALEKGNNVWSFIPIQQPFCISSVSCGKEHVLLRTQIGGILSFGSGSRGQLGHDSLINMEKPMLIEALNGLTVTSIAAGGWHSLAVTDSGDVYVWGWNESGQLGLPSKSISGEKDRDIVNIQTFPQLLTYTHTQDDLHVSLCAAGSRHSAIMTENREVFTFGWNKYGQLCLEDKLSRDTPTRINHSALHKQKVVQFLQTLPQKDKMIFSSDKNHSAIFNDNVVIEVCNVMIKDWTTAISIELKIP